MKAIKFLRSIGCVLAASFWFSAWGKQIEIEVGDQLPDITVSNIFGKPKAQISLKELRSQGMLLIDFWATWCAPCLHDMKKLEAIKEELPFPVPYLSITHQDVSEVAYFFSSSPQSEGLEAPKLLIATNDTLLNRIFRHRFLPHYVWVDSSGRVGAITGSDALTASNFRTFRQTGTLQARKKDDRMDYRAADAFHLGDSIFSYRSIIVPYIPGIGSTDLSWSAGGDSSRYVHRFLKNNGLMTEFYRAAYGFKLGKYDANYRPELIEIHTTDSLKYFYPSDNQFGKRKHLLDNSPYKDREAWEKANLYTYELCLSRPVVDTVFGRYMFEDLNRFFQVDASIEPRKLMCWTIRYHGNRRAHMVPSSDSHLPAYVIFSSNRDSLIANNVTIDQFFAKLFAKYPSSETALPFILENTDRLDYRFNLALSLTDYLQRIEKRGIELDIIFKELEKIGFSFSKEVRDYPVLVLRDFGIE